MRIEEAANASITFELGNRNRQWLATVNFNLPEMLVNKFKDNTGIPLSDPVDL